MPRSRKLFIILISAIALFLVLILWHLTARNHYEATTPTRGTAIQAVYATGVVEPLYWSIVSAQLTGRVQAIKEDEGTEVQQGQVLASLDDAVEQAKVEELTARLGYLEKELARKKSLSIRDISSLRDFEQTTSDYNATKAQLDAQNELIARMQITSPMDGVVLRRGIEPGEIALQGNPVFWVGKPSPLRITAEVDEEDIPLVTPKQQVLIKADAFPGEIFMGTVTEVTPKGDPVNKSFRVRIALPEKIKLLIGMTVEVNILVRKEENALLIPASSVINNAVWLQNGSKIEKKHITSGIKDEENIQVIKGLTEKDRILLRPGLYLAEKRKQKP